MSFMSEEQYDWVQSTLIGLVGAVDRGFASLEGRIGHVEARLDGVERGLNLLERRFSRFEIRTDERFFEMNDRLAALEKPKHKKT